MPMITKKSVKIVLGNVKPVMDTHTIVESVKVTDSVDMVLLVNAHMDTSNNGLSYVQNVLTNVTLVNKKKNTVPFVLKTEFIFLSVLVHMDITISTYKLTVQPVTKNVNLVSKLLTTVSNVLKD
jgi:hypothetical protein